ncbi:MAG: MFS transporter [Rhodobacteraceae bacterium]|nr:MFS transporter [Paracoccaceae bacterium]
MGRFVQDNARWLATGLLLAFGSSFGQTYFIALFAGEIRAAHGLSNGDWGLLYTLATLGSALLLLGWGSLADTVPFSRLVPVITGLYACAALAMALGQSVWVLGLAVFLLRFCGQGMFGHIAATAMGRWFVATRGRAVAIKGLGYPLGEVSLPLLYVGLIAWIGWRQAWGVTAAVILFGLLPLLMGLLARDRVPKGQTGTTGSPGLGGRHWTRGAALGHWLFPALVPLMLTPGFIGTVVFFHQVHVAEVKGWTLAQMAAGYPVYAVVTVISALVAGQAVDRFGVTQLLPLLVVPMGAAMFLIGPASAPWHWAAALGVLGLSQGMVGTFWGAFLPAIYGTDNLGAIWSLVVALLVISTAIGPGITGLVIDWGVSFPRQGVAMGLWCLILAAGMLPVRAKLLDTR